MKNVISFCLIVLIASNTFAQVDEKAKEVLNKIATTYKSYDAIAADFNMTFDFPETDEDETQSGKVFIAGDSYKLELNGTTIITDNSTIWTYLEEVNEVQVSEYEPDETAITPSQIFNLYEQDFYAEFIGTESEFGKKISKIDLTPNDKDLPYFKIRMTIEAETGHILKAVVFDKNANKYIYEINNFDPKVELKDDFFNFNEADYPDVEIIDFR